MFFKVSEYLTTSIFFLDILYNFNRAYNNSKGKLIVSRSKIACNYLKTWFVIDLIASFPFFIFSNLGKESASFGLKTIKILRIMNIVRLFRLVKLIKEFFPKNMENKTKRYVVKFKKNMERLVVHSFLVFIICHLFACLFYSLPMTFSPDINWVVLRNLENKPEFEKYLFAMHWMIETIITVGYGENDIRYYTIQSGRTNYQYHIRAVNCHSGDDHWSDWILLRGK